MYTRTLGAVIFVLVVVVVLAGVEFFGQNHHLRTDAYTADQSDGADRMMYTR